MIYLVRMCGDQTTWGAGALFHCVGPGKELKSSGVVGSWVTSAAPIITALKSITF